MMENLYESLRCKNFTGVEELRRSYLALVKEFHPDKNIDEIGHTSDCPNENHKREVKEDGKRQTIAKLEKFINIDKAWKVLKDEELKEKYDLVLKQRLLCQDWPIQDELEISEFDEDTSNSNYIHICRCGGQYILNCDDVRFHLDYVCCDSCSLCVKIIYLQEFPD